MAGHSAPQTFGDSSTVQSPNSDCSDDAGYESSSTATISFSDVVAEHSRRDVVYYYDRDVETINYGMEHPMKPYRIAMTHSLVLNYGLYRKLKIYRPERPTLNHMLRFHTLEYMQFLQQTSTKEFQSQLHHSAAVEQLKLRHNLDQTEDCPTFERLFEFCQISSGGSLAGAWKINQRKCDIAINWSGGLHHAKRNRASGFCYVNDIVLAIKELLKFHQRVLYIDIDIHHGDAVEEAFYSSNRVMTVSFHKYDGTFFPYTGDIAACGSKQGKYHAINFPMKDFIDDASYVAVFKTVIDRVVQHYSPQVIVMQMGADSLANDHVGTFNLTLRGHSACLEHVQRYKIPLLVLGGGGYHVANVARCWTYETARIIGADPLPEQLPFNKFYYKYAPSHKLHIPALPNDNEHRSRNSVKYLEKMQAQVFEYLRHVEPVPSVAIAADVPDSEIPDASAKNFFQVQKNGIANICTKNSEADENFGGNALIDYGEGLRLDDRADDHDAASVDVRISQTELDNMIERDADLPDRAESSFLNNEATRLPIRRCNSIVSTQSFNFLLGKNCNGVADTNEAEQRMPPAKRPKSGEALPLRTGFFCIRQPSPVIETTPARRKPIRRTPTTVDGALSIHLRRKIVPPQHRFL